MKTLLVDGNNLLARADFAAKGKHVEMSVGEVNTAALTIFINMLSRYVRQVQPTHIKVCWDAGHDYRDQIYPAYKAARRKPPEQHDALEDPGQPFAQAKEFLTWAGVSHSQIKGWEADDLIAATTRNMLDKVVILSGDKDLLQLVEDPVTQMCSGFGGKRGTRHVTQIRPPDSVEWDEDLVEQKFGVNPAYLAHYLALVGDTGDGVPGLKGIGPKRAVKMLADAQWDWEALMGTLDAEKAKQARLMHSLVDLRTLPYPSAFLSANYWVAPFEPVSPASMVWPMLEEFCQRYRLASVMDRLLDHTLWGEAEKPSSDGVFDDVDTPATVLDPSPGHT